MSSETQTSSTAADPAVSPQTFDVQAVKNWLEQLKTFSSETGLKMICEIVNVNTDLQAKLGSKDEEIANLGAEMEEMRKNKEIAIKEMFETNGQEKRKQEEIVARVTALEASLKQKDAALVEQESIQIARNKKFEDLTASFTEEKAKVERSHKEIAGLLKKVKGQQDTIDNMKATESGLKKGLSISKKKVKELEEEKQNSERKLEASLARTQELEGFTAGYQEGNDNSLLDEFSELWKFATDEINLHLKENLAPEALANHQAWEALRKPDILAVRHQVPLPPSNSEEAKQMRLAVILAILAREIDKHIFQPTYILSEDSWIREVLANLALKNAKKESFCRSLLLSIEPESQTKLLEGRIQAVVRNVAVYFLGLLSDAQYQEFHRSLEKVTRRAADIWIKIQRAQAKYEPDFEPRLYGDHEWTPFLSPDDGPAVDQNADDAGEEALLTVFPRISQLENNRRDPCNYVIELRRSMPMCMNAGRELVLPSTPTLGRMTSNRQRQRKMSTASGQQNAQNGNFLGKSGPPGVSVDG